MSDIKKCRELLVRYSTARIPFISINTIEPARTIEALKSVAEELQLVFYAHSPTKGVYDILTDKVVCEDKSIYGAMDYMTALLMSCHMKLSQFL